MHTISIAVKILNIAKHLLSLQLSYNVLSLAYRYCVSISLGQDKSILSTIGMALNDPGYQPVNTLPVEVCVFCGIIRCCALYVATSIVFLVM